jgi:succinyl-CoA synthetase beta subunit
MNIHEYQGKEILAKHGVRVQRGYVANNPQEAVDVAKQLTAETGTGWHVIKAQIHAGGRGKGGGVKLAKNLKQVEEIANQIDVIEEKRAVVKTEIVAEKQIIEDLKQQKFERKYPRNEAADGGLMTLFSMKR